MNNDERYARLFAGEDGSVLGDFSNPIVESKTKRAETKQGLTGAPDPERKRRLPPGQRLTKEWPVLDLGQKPLIPLDQWELTIAGAVENKIRWDWATFLEHGQSKSISDIHCVTQWSRYDNHWQGVSALDLIKAVKPKPEVRHVIFHSHDGYRTNVRMEQFARDGVLLAHKWEGEDIPREHGGPVRIVIPELYFWKSAKWVRHIVFLEHDAKGYWEASGYHNNGDPWKEERYG